MVGPLAAAQYENRSRVRCAAICADSKRSRCQPVVWWRRLGLEVSGAHSMLCVCMRASDSIVCSIASDQRTLVAACEDGSLRIFSIADGALVYSRFVTLHRRMFRWLISVPQIAVVERCACVVLRVSSAPQSGGAGGCARPHGGVGSRQQRADLPRQSQRRCRRGALRARARAVRHNLVLTRAVVQAAVEAVCFADDGTVVTGDFIGYAQFWDVATQTLLHSFRSHTSCIQSIIAAPGPSVFASGMVRNCFARHLRRVDLIRWPRQDPKVVRFVSLGKGQWTPSLRCVLCRVVNVLRC